ncbi:MAG: ATPase, T2SS/T4P/T4SS family [Pirellulaceae bacterium]
MIHTDSNATDRNLIVQWGRAIVPLARDQELISDVSFANERELLEWSQEQGIGEAMAFRALAKLLEVEWVDQTRTLQPSADFIKHVPIGLARRFCMLGVAADLGSLPVLVADLKGWRELDVVGRMLNRSIEPRFADREQITRAINIAYQDREGQTVNLLGSMDVQESLNTLATINSREDLLDLKGRAPVITLVNSTLFDAVKSRASDVHFQPYEDRLVVRFRIDGVLYDTFTIPKAVQEEVLSRVKVLGNMNIAEKRLPQDGRSTVQLGDRLIDLRIASLPTSFGERIVVRLLDKSARLYTLGELGLNEQMLERFRRLIHLEHGLVLVTGPTGAGKSTTLYAALQEIDTKNRNVVTLEDPIEYQLEGISQTQVNERKGLTFASGLRNVLRQDPDIIMVGEIRDQETAEMAIQSALTGHLVFSTLHTNDAASAVTRLIDLGIEPYLVASSLIGVLAQRLVRRICESCRQEMPAQNLDLFQLTDKSQGAGPHRVFQGRGCATCRSTGYFGRIGVFELMAIDEKIQSLIQKKSDSSQIRQTANQNGMRLLQEDGLEKILAGRTTIEEVIRISMRV